MGRKSIRTAMFIIETKFIYFSLFFTIIFNDLRSKEKFYERRVSSSAKDHQRASIASGKFSASMSTVPIVAERSLSPALVDRSIIDTADNAISPLVFPRIVLPVWPTASVVANGSFFLVFLSFLGRTRVRLSPRR